MSVSISTSSIAELGVIGWRYTQLIARKGHNPANYVDFLNSLNTVALVAINDAGDGSKDQDDLDAAYALATPELCSAAFVTLATPT